MIAIAQSKLDATSPAQLSFAAQDAARLPEGPHDVILALNLLHLLPDLETVLQQIYDALPSGGLLIAKTGLLKDGLWLIPLIIPLLKAIGKAPYVRKLSAVEMLDLLKETGFVIDEQLTQAGVVPRIFTVANQKGGVGKTTTAVNLAAALSMGGLKVLLIDLDPQGNASTAFGIDRVNTAGIYDVLINDLPMANAAVKVTNFPFLEAIAANSDLAGAEIQLVPAVAREFRLQAALQTFLTAKQNAGQRFDYVFIDCPPSLGLLTINALAAADEVLVPIQCEYYSLEGVSLLLETLGEVQKRLNPKISLTTIVLTMFDSRTRLANDVADNVKKHFPNELINIPIPRAVRVSEAPSYGQTVMTYDASSPGAIAYMSVAREIANRGGAPIKIKNESA